MSLARIRPSVAFTMTLSLAALAGCGATSPKASYGGAEARSEESAARSAPRPFDDAPAADAVASAPPATAAAQPSPGAAAPAKEAAKKAEAARVAGGAPTPPPPAQMAVAPAATAKPVVESEPDPVGTEHYKDYGVNPFVETSKDRLSTFSIDVDTASYSIARRKIVEGSLPSFAAVRAEEFLNSFDYGYEGPGAGSAHPFAIHVDAAPSPFAKGKHLVRVGVQAKRIAADERLPVHLVYLVDTSGSMSGPDRLGLAQKSLEMLTEKLRPGDTVALCTYAGSVRTVLEPTGIEHRSTIIRAIHELASGGGTSMSSGIENAYALASKTLVKGHVNRVVVLSDGDANIGNTSHDQILASIRRYKERGITLSTVGFGSGNYKDVMMERLADEGDGNYSYIDSENEAKRVFQREAESLLQVVARDVKIQVELDPTVVARYRLVGYENRDIKDKDFRNDKVDAGEVGSGHSVTALYEVELKRTDASPLTVRLRHKPAKNALHGGGDSAREMAVAMPAARIARSFDEAPESLRFATAVAGFAEVLRKSPHAHDVTFAELDAIAASASAARPERAELRSLLQRASRLTGGTAALVAR